MRWLRSETEEKDEDEDEKLRRVMAEINEKNRNKDQICLTCRFWDFEDDEGRCKRYPPSVKSGPTNRIDMWEFPKVVYDDWCGEWQPLPNKDGYYAVASPIDDVDDEE